INRTRSTSLGAKLLAASSPRSPSVCQWRSRSTASPVRAASSPRLIVWSIPSSSGRGLGGRDTDEEESLAPLHRAVVLRRQLVEVAPDLRVIGGSHGMSLSQTPSSVAARTHE